MAEEPASSFPASRPARDARARLAEALLALQARSTPQLDRAVECLAEASSALYEVETAAKSARGAGDGVRIAVERLVEALSLLQVMPDEDVTHPTEVVAATLALLYPVARERERRRRAVVMAGLSDSSGDPPPLPAPPQPEPTGRARRATPVNDERRGPLRTFVEVDIGLASDSNFYTGLSCDLSTGGVFIATYRTLPTGTRVRVAFNLPDGETIEAAGLVCWTRDATAESAPGMGVRFESIDDEALRAVERFCRSREPLYHDVDG